MTARADKEGLTDDELKVILNQISVDSYIDLAGSDWARGIACLHQGMLQTAIRRIASAAYAYEVAYNMLTIECSERRHSTRTALLEMMAMLERLKRISEVQRTSYREERPHHG